MRDRGSRKYHFTAGRIFPGGIMTIEDKQPKVYSLKVTFECPPGIKKEDVEKYVKDHVFIEGWAGRIACVN